MRQIILTLAVVSLFNCCLPAAALAESVNELLMTAVGYTNNNKPELAEKALLRALELDIFEGSTRIQLAAILAERKAWGSVGLVLKPLLNPWNSWNVRARKIVEMIPESIARYKPRPIPADSKDEAGKRWEKEIGTELQWYLNFGPASDEAVCNPASSPEFAEFFQAIQKEVGDEERDFASTKKAMKKVFPEFAAKLFEFRNKLKFRWEQWDVDGFLAVVAISIDDEKLMNSLLEKWPEKVKRVLFLNWMQQYVFEQQQSRLPKQDLPILTYMDSIRNELKNYADQAPLFQSLANGCAALEKQGESEENRRLMVESLSFEECEKLAEAGDMYAQTQLATLYCKKSNDDSDFEKARIWFSKAADQGDPVAMFQLGDYFEAEGPAQDFKKAFKYYLEASKKGHIISQSKVAKMLIEGNGADKNPEEGRAWLYLSKIPVQQMAPDEFEPILLKEMTADQLKIAQTRSEELKKEYGLSHAR